MTEQIKFINRMLDKTIRHYEFRMNSAKEDMMKYDNYSIIQSSSNVVSECATALELLNQMKEFVEYSEQFNKDIK